MTAKYFALLTQLGAAKLANATALGTSLNLTQMAVGDANGVLPSPDASQTKLINQKRIAPLNMLSIDPENTNQIIAEQVIPENEGGYWIREIGLFDDEGVLIAVANCPETYKPQMQEGSGRTQTVRMVLVVSNTASVTLKIDPAVVLATRKYVDQAVAEHELSRRHPDATLAGKGFTQLSSATDSDAENLAATPKAVKAAVSAATAANTNANGRVPSTRKVNGLALGADITITTITGNAATATKLATARTINGIAFDGTANITLPTPASVSYTRAESDTRYVQNVQRGAAVNPGKANEYGPNEAPAGCVLTRAWHDPSTSYGVFFTYRPLQILINGAWRTIAG
ncbi:phage tail protein [Vagococcus sp. WN89Y]|uniref:phage tail protein n=1 Tax=Vagococcus sp. WN89Y TaxID=3457258 RepID=UPI003FCD1B36